MPASGKTKWGSIIAQHFHLPFVDLDELIEQQAGKTIQEIFEASGENGFRIIEKQTLKKLIAENKSLTVISCGGGTTLDPTNLELMKKNGVVIFLNAKMETILNNLKTDTTQRPLLANPFTQLELLFKKRAAIYQQADHILEVETLTINQFEPIITSCIKQH